jgi:hypothetical protein
VSRSEDVDAIPSVWSMRCKRNLTTDEITKNKSRLNLHGGQQVFGMNSFETYALVATWFMIRLIIIIALLFTLSLRQIDFIQAYPQAPIDADKYIESPQGIETRHGSSKDHIFMLLSNVYGQNRQAAFGTPTCEKLCSIRFQPSLINACVFFHDNVIFIVYVDDGIFLGPGDQKLTNVICKIRKVGLDIEDQVRPDIGHGSHGPG